MGFNVAVAQMNSEPGNIKNNMQRVEQLMRSAKSLSADLVILPETFSSGFDVASNLDAATDTIPGEITHTISELAKSLGIYFYGSMLEKDENGFYNTGVLISPDGKLEAKYRKVHLFSVEKEMFIPGNKEIIVETDIGKLGLTICMDLLFPEYIRGLVLSGAEYILNTTNWLRYGNIDKWEWSYKQTQSLAMIRALENTVCLAMACQWGQENDYYKFGHSCIVSPSGRILAGIKEGEGVVSHYLGMEDVDEWRSIATYLKDRQDNLKLYRDILHLQ